MTALAHFATTTRLDDVPTPARQAACWAMLDAIACALAGYAEPVAERVRAFVQGERAAGTVAIWGDRSGTSATGAALANGTAAHALDFDDVCWAMNAHPSCVLTAAAMAVAESTGASGAALLHAYVVGFEAEARLGEAMAGRHYETGWHPTATLGTFGATMAAGVLLDLSEERLRAALGIACSLAAGTRLSFGTDTKPLHAGRAAESGVTAALLAARGVTATPDGLEGRMGFMDLYAGQGGAIRTDLDRFALLDPGIEHKPYPSCRFTHRVIEAVGRIRARNGREPQRIVCTVNPFSREILRYASAETGLEAKFSMQTCAALAWLDGIPGPETFRDARVTRDDVRRMASRVELVDGAASEESVAITFAGGSVDQETIALPLGHPERPIPEADHLAKIRTCSEARLSKSAARELVDSMTHLESVPDVRVLGRVLGSSERR